MVNLDSRLAETKRLVDQGDYFVINRARQYGKTTMLRALREYLWQEYAVFSLDFQRIGTAGFQAERTFSAAFAELFAAAAGKRKKKVEGLNPAAMGQLQEAAEAGTDLKGLHCGLPWQAIYL